MTYTDGFKSRLVQRMAGPEGITAAALGRELGLSQPTLSRWLREAATVDGMSSKENGNVKGREHKARTPEEKLRLLGTASQVSDEDLGAFLRSEGLHETTLRRWQQAATEALAALDKTRRAKKSPEAKRVTELEQELGRKEKALAELAALMVLQKKVRAIWGDGADGTNARSES